MSGVRRLLRPRVFNVLLYGAFSDMANQSRIGFLGMGIMGTPMAMNLVRSGHNVAVWNRTTEKTKPVVALGATFYTHKKDLFSNCDIVFACVSDPAAARDIVFGKDGIADYITSGKAYVDMSTVDAETSIAIGNAIKEKGGRFLEAPVSGTKKPAEDGTLIIMGAGDKSLYEECDSCFKAMGKESFYLGDLGAAAKMKLVVNAVMGAHMTALSEGMVLAEKSALSQDTLLKILSLGALSSPMVNGKGAAIINSNFAPNFPLKHQQKDLRLALSLAESLGEELPTIDAANGLFKKAIGDGRGDEDMCSVYNAVAKK